MSDDELPDWLEPDLWHTSIAEVKSGKFETGLDDAEIAEHIDDANLEITQKLEDHYDDRTLRKMERDGARHSIKYTVEEERMVESETIGSIQQDYMGAFSSDDELEETPHGKKVLAKDTKNILQKDEFWAVTV